MRDDLFEWDDAKAASNLRKHGISFDLARRAFEDPLALERLDLDVMDEERLLLTGMADGSFLTVVFAERGTRMRIISARKASRHEQAEYAAQSRSTPGGRAGPIRNDACRLGAP